MKRIVLLTFMFLSVVSFATSKERVITEKELPNEVTTFIKEHFGAYQFSYAKQERNEYSVKIVSNGAAFELDFENGKIESIESKNKMTPIPTTALAKDIVDYVSSNYPDVAIVKWEKDRTKQSVEMSNKVELEFDLNGKFLRRDY